MGGDSFLDLTGADPDTAANLADLILINDLSDLDALGGAEVVLSGGERAIALAVTVDDGPTLVLPAATAPDRRYLWLDRVTDTPIHLAAGEHTLRVTYTGSEQSRRVVVDGFLLQPVIAQRVFAGPNGERLTLIFDTVTGVSTLQEEG